MKSRLGTRGNPKCQASRSRSLRPRRDAGRSASELDSASLLSVAAATLPRDGEACHRRQGITGAWRRAVRGGWRRQVSRESPGNLGGPAGRTGQQVAPVQRRQGIQNLLSCPGRESDLPIVARKRLTPVEPRGRTLIVFSSREGKPLEHKLCYGRRVQARTWLAPETFPVAMKAGPQGQAGAEVPVLGTV
jgi:hypothetical protein